MEIYEDLLVGLECPICTNYMSPPIRQCATGHSICEACCKRLPKCALCQGDFTDSRNIAMEGLAVKMRYPCINKGAGCDVKLSYTERETHELHCTKKGYRCPMERCTWTGRLEEIAAHWASKKMSSKPYKKNNVCHTKMKNESYYVNMVEAHNKMFWFKCKLTNNKLFWSVQYVGNAAEAENYYYEIEIFKPGQVKKKILMSDYCQAIDLENSQLFTGDACMSINTDSIGGFVSDDQLLIYYLRVFYVDNKAGKAEAAAAGVAQPNAPPHPGPKKGAKPKFDKNHAKGPHANKAGPKKKNAQPKPEAECADFIVL